MLQYMFEFWYLCKCSNNDRLWTAVSDLCASFQRIFHNISALFMLLSAALWSGEEGGMQRPVCGNYAI